MPACDLRLILNLVIVLAVAPFAQAQDVGDVPMGEIGDAQAGFEYAQATCAPCHAIGEEKSPIRRRQASRTPRIHLA